MRKILIDTDVILDFFFDREPFSDHAAKLLSECEKGVVNGFITAVILSNVYYLLRQTSTHEKVLEKLNLLMTILDILVIDKKIALSALNSDFKDFEDALQNFSAQSSGIIDALITRNIKDYKRSQLVVMTPESFLSGFHV